MPHRQHREMVDGRNRLSYHFVVGILACALTALFWLGDVTLNQATAAAAFVFLCLVMIIGPAMRLWWKPYLRKLPYGIPRRWRGELGIWFALLAITHTLLVWHGRHWQVLPLRHSDLVGLVALVWTLGLAATSSAGAIRLLGIGQWKWLQATGAYVIFYLVVVHTVYHAWLRPRFDTGIVGYIYAGLMLLVIVLQVTTYFKFVLDAKGIRLRTSTKTLLTAIIGAGFAGLGVWAWLAPDSDERLLRVHEWLPEELVVDLQVQTAFNDEEIYFQFQWEQPNPGGWYHDMLVFQSSSGSRVRNSMRSVNRQ